MNELARKSKVSVARFVRFIGLLHDSLVLPPTQLQTMRTVSVMKPISSEKCDSGTSTYTVPGLSGMSVLLCFLWVRAADKGCLLTFLLAVASHLPHGSVFAEGCEWDDLRWRQQWEKQTFIASDAAHASADVVRSIVSQPAEPQVRRLGAGGRRLVHLPLAAC